MFYNRSGEPLTVESVSLVQPHNLVLRGAVVYKMIHSRHALSLEWGWAENPDVPAADWNARQHVPGAIIPAEDGPLSYSGLNTRNPDLYEIAVGLSAMSPAGGTALGEVIRYRAGNNSYVLKFMTGMAIAAATPGYTACNRPVAAIQAAFNSSSGAPS
jgi:hypothetical protein